MTEEQTLQNTENVAETPRPRTRRRKPKPDRTLEQLHEATIRSMSESEMRKYIEALREANQELEQKTQSLTENCTSAYKKAQYWEGQYQQLRSKAAGLLHFAKQAISTCHNSIILAGGLDD